MSSSPREAAVAARVALRRQELDTGASTLGGQSDLDGIPRERPVIEDYQLAIDHTEARLGELDARLAEIAETEPYREAVGWLRCFRGIDTLTAMLILAELHDFRRFASAPALMAYLGLVPGEDSSGENIGVAASRGPGTRSFGGCWWKPRGTINTVRTSASH